MQKKTRRAASAMALSTLLTGGQMAHAGIDPMMGEITLYAFSFAPSGWFNATGQMLSIAQNAVLFSVLGTTYGGNGSTTFMLPNLTGRTAIGKGAGDGISLTTELGEQRGATTATLNGIPGTSGTSLTLETRGVETSTRVSGSVAVPTVAKSALTGNSGQPIGVRPPTLGLNYSIAQQGIYGSRSCMVGEIIAYAGTYTSGTNLLPTAGQLLSIASNTALFAILGTTYGGDGQTTFALPNLSGRLPVGAGTGPGFTPVSLGERDGANTATVTASHMPTAGLGQHLATKGIGVNTSARVTTHPVDVIQAATPVSGANVTLPVQPPSLGVSYYICAQGSFPAHQ